MRRICKVTWLDATGGVRAGWRPLRTIGGPAETVISVGFLLKDDDVVILVPHLSGEEGDGEICIPRTWIKEVVELVPARKKKSPGSDG